MYCPIVFIRWRHSAPIYYITSRVHTSLQLPKRRLNWFLLFCRVDWGRRVHRRFIWWKAQRRVDANPQTKRIDLGCESAENWQLPFTSTIAIVIITQPVSWYSFYRPKHCCNGAQPVPKTVYRSGCHDKHELPSAWFEPWSSHSHCSQTR